MANIWVGRDNLDIPDRKLVFEAPEIALDIGYWLRRIFGPAFIGKSKPAVYVVIRILCRCYRRCSGLLKTEYSWWNLLWAVCKSPREFSECFPVAL